MKWVKGLMLIFLFSLFYLVIFGFLVLPVPKSTSHGNCELQMMSLPGRTRLKFAEACVCESVTNETVFVKERSSSSRKCPFFIIELNLHKLPHRETQKYETFFSLTTPLRQKDEGPPSFSFCQRSPARVEETTRFFLPLTRLFIFDRH